MNGRASFFDEPAIVEAAYATMLSIAICFLWEYLRIRGNGWVDSERFHCHLKSTSSEEETICGEHFRHLNE